MERAGSSKPGWTWLISTVSVVVILLSFVQLFAAPGKTAVTFDEPIHSLRTQAWLDQGWYVPVYVLKDGEPGEGVASPYVYGPAFAATAHAANRVLGNESAGEVSDSQSSWDIRHLTSAMLAVAGALAAALAVWAITGSRLFALWTAAALFAVPLWTGMGFFNPKDTPAAAGYTMFTAGLVLAIAKGAGRPPPWRLVAIVLLLACGYFFGAGTRLALWLPLTASLGVFIIGSWAKVRFSGRPREPLTWSAVGLGFFAGVLSTILIYPSVFAKPFEFLGNTITASGDFGWSGYTLTAGRLLSENVPWWYLPAWIVASVPTLILLLAAFGAAVGLRRKRESQDSARRLSSLLGRLDYGVVIVLFQAVPLALGSVLVSSVMYTGLRQHLYVVPALAILAGVGSFHLGNRPTGDGSRPGWQRPVTLVLLSIALIVPAVEQAIIFPYNYAYVSPVAGINGVNGQWETDFWWASRREAIDRAPDDADPYCSAQTQSDLTYFGRSSYARCSIDARDLATQDPVHPADTRTWVIARLRSGGRLPAYCQGVDNVTRWLRGEQVVMSYVARCDRDEVVARDGGLLP